MYNGIIPILKPSGWTSHDVVMKLRRLLKTKKIGHTGTLDPDVTGVLPICIGRSTRVVQFLTECDKEYVCTICIGSSTTTEDACGEVVKINTEWKSFTREQILAVLAQLVGTIRQTPPMYSAVKVNGKKLYEYARKGQEVKRPTRLVEIHEMTLLDEQEKFEGEMVTFTFCVNCSKGTYIRTLAVDIGAKLGYPAHMQELKRTKSGSFLLEDCVTIEKVQEMVKINQVDSILFPLERGIAHLPKAIVSDEMIQDVKNGKKIQLPAEFQNQVWIGVYSQEKRAYAVYESFKETYKPVRVFISANEEDN